MNFFIEYQYDVLKHISEKKFTEREVDVLSCIISARTSRKSIALTLGIEASTAAVHIANIRAKLECSSWEQIRDFIEETGYAASLQNHFNNLVRFNNLNNILSKIKHYIKQEEKVFVIESYKKEEYKLNEVISCLKKVGVDITIEQSKKEHCLEDPTDAFMVFKIKNQEKLFNINSYHSIEYLIFEIIYFLFPHKEIKEITSQLKITQNNADNVIKPALKLSNKNHKTLYTKVEYISSFFAIFFILLGYTYFTLFKKHEKLDISQEVKLPDDSFLLKRENIINTLDELYNKSHQSGNIPIISICGMGGVGKTTIVRLWQKRFKHKNPKALIWECNAENEDETLQSMKNLAISLAKTSEDRTFLSYIETLKKEEKIQQLLIFLRKKLVNLNQWILVFDNIESMSEVEKYIPQDPSLWGNGKIILTTRNENLSPSTSMHFLPINKLSKSEKRTLFFNYIHKNKKFSKSDDDIEKLLAKIPPFPLDISMAARYIKSQKISYEEYINVLEKGSRIIEEIHNELAEEDNIYKGTRYKIISNTLEKIINKNKKFIDLLIIISLSYSQEIPFDILVEHTDYKTAYFFLRELKKYSLFTNDKNLHGENVLSLHRSIQNFIRSYMLINYPYSSNKKLFFNVFQSWESYLYNLIDQDNFLKLIPLMPHVKKLKFFYVLGKHTQYKVEGILGYMNAISNDTYGAKDILEKSLPLLIKNFLHDHENIARQLTSLSFVYRKLGLHSKSEICLKTSLTHSSKQDKRNSQYAKSLYYLALLYLELGEVTKAIECMEESCDISKNLEIPNILKLTRRATLNTMYTRIGNYEKAYQFIQENDFSKLNLENIITYPFIFDIISDLYYVFGEYGKSMTYNDHSIAMLCQYKMENYGNAARSIANKARILKDIGKYKQVLEWIKKAVCFYHKNYLHAPFLTATMLEEANIYMDIGMLERAKNILEQCHQKVNYGSTYFKYVYEVKYATYLMLIGQLEEAKKKFEDILVFFETSAYKKNIINKAIKVKLGYTYLKLGQHEKAKQLIIEGLSGYQKHYGESHLRIAEPIRYLGEVYCDQNNLEKAEALFIQSFEILEKYENHPDIFLVYECLAKVYQKKAQNSEKDLSLQYSKKAKNYLKQALKIAEENFPKESEHIKRTRKLLNELTL